MSNCICDQTKGIAKVCDVHYPQQSELFPNQCDGCQAGMPIRVGTGGARFHTDGRGRLHMICTEEEPT